MENTDENDLDGNSALSLDRSERPKRGKKNGTGSRRTVVTRQEFVDDGEEKDKGDDPPLFSSQEMEEKAVSRIRVIRRTPDEGFLGYLDDPSGTESEILERWGGSTYRLEGCNSIGRVVAVRTVKLAGDPIFISQSAKTMWERGRGILGSGTPAAPAPGMSFTEMMAMMQEREAQRRKEDDERDERRRKDEREAAERLRKIELDAAEARRIADAERERQRIKDEAERDDRRRKDDLEREERRNRDLAAAETNRQQFFQQTLTMVRESSSQALAVATAGSKGDGQGGLLEALKVIASIKETFADNDKSGDGEQDIVSLIVKHGPEWLSSAGNAIGGAIREVKGTPPGAAPVAQAQRQLTGMNLGALQPKVETLVEKIAAKGQDPEVVLSKVLDNLIAVSDKQTPPHKAGVASTPVNTKSYAEQAEEERLKREAASGHPGQPNLATKVDIVGAKDGTGDRWNGAGKPPRRAEVGPVTDGTVAIAFP